MNWYTCFLFIRIYALLYCHNVIGYSMNTFFENPSSPVTI